MKYKYNHQQDRKNFIGGSDAVRIMHDNWYDLWAEKTGIREPEDLSNNISVQIGIATENLNCKIFLDTDKRFSRYQQRTGVKSIIHNDVPYCGTVDMLVIRNDKTIKAATNKDLAIVECKHTYENNSMRNQLKRYMPQLQFYMFINEINECYFCNIFGNRRWECSVVDIDFHYIKKMNEYIRIFWDCVVKNEAPTDQVVVDEICIDKIPVNKMVRRNANTDNAFISYANEYIDTINYVKQNEMAKKQLKSMVASNESEVYSDILSINRDKRGALRFNIQKENIK
tara:strand:- start:3331 stop:4182 length:852 start_codon:yes stop_codon:yes gene_type:complete